MSFLKSKNTTTHLVAATGTALVLALSACGSSSGVNAAGSASPGVDSPGASTSSALAASPDPSASAACTAATSAWSTFVADFNAAATPDAKAVAVAKGAAALAEAAFDLSSAAVDGSGQAAAHDTVLNQDATAVTNDFKTIVNDLKQHDTSAAGTEFSGQLSTDAGTLVKDCAAS